MSISVYFWVSSCNWFGQSICLFFDLTVYCLSGSTNFWFPIYTVSGQFVCLSVDLTAECPFVSLYLWLSISRVCGRYVCYSIDLAVDCLCIFQLTWQWTVHLSPYISDSLFLDCLYSLFVTQLTWQWTVHLYLNWLENWVYVCHLIFTVSIFRVGGQSGVRFPDLTVECLSTY